MKNEQFHEALTKALRETSLLLAELTLQNSMHYSYNACRECLDEREAKVYQAITEMRLHYGEEVTI